MIDALAYVDQLAVTPYASDLDYGEDYEPLDTIAGY
jgi:hypothetical protein